MRHAVAVALLALAAGASAPPLSIAQAPAEKPVLLSPAPPETVREIHAAIVQAHARLEARDAAGVLAHVSEQYRSGLWTKAEVRRQLLGFLQLCDTVRANVRIDSVHVADRGGVWVYTTGEISGRVALVGTWMTLLSWKAEPEVARREGASWRLFGFQQ